MKPLVVIPARGGSKGLPGKNIKLLNGKPLIHYSIECARSVFSDHQIMVSTDDPEIKRVAEMAGIIIPELRPAHLATDHAGSYEVLLHCIQQSIRYGYDPDTVVLLQPTSPFRNESHIEEALQMYDDICELVVSVKVTKSNPYYLLFEENEEGWLKKSKTGIFERRQDCPLVYELNGAIYVIRVSSLLERPINEFEYIRKYVMNPNVSLDIDTQIDWDIAEMLLEKGYV